MRRRLSNIFRWLGTGFGLWALAGPAIAGCHETRVDETDFVICEYAAAADIRLALYGDDGEPLATFSGLRDQMSAQGLHLRFAMNAGMYHDDRRPVGLYIEDGQALSALHNRAGPGNFSMLPNGVFFIENGLPQVLSSDQYLARPRTPDFATQSGPMLVIDGRFHPRFRQGSDSRRERNGVGIRRSDGAVIFVIADDPVNFYDFASLFRDELGCDNALYLDGVVSKIYAPELGRQDRGLPMGPIVAVVTPRPE